MSGISIFSKTERWFSGENSMSFLCLLKNAGLVLTDSGGIQEETTGLRIPCVTVRTNTERPVTVLEGTNLLAGLREEIITKAIQTQLGKGGGSGRIPKFWDGKAAERIVDVIVQRALREQ